MVELRATTEQNIIIVLSAQARTQKQNSRYYKTSALKGTILFAVMGVKMYAMDRGKRRHTLCGNGRRAFAEVRSTSCKGTIVLKKHVTPTSHF